MQPFQERVIEEKRELDEKIAKLDLFWKGDVFLTLPSAEQVLLRRQLVAMEDYSAMLGERITAFST
jgi:hypothetical protein